MESSLKTLSVEQIARLSSQALVLPMLVQLSVVVLFSLIMGELARFLKQPRPVGWIAAGIILGPSGLGEYIPWLSQWIFHMDQLGVAPPAVGIILPHTFFGIAELGLMFLLFPTGAEFDFAAIKEHKKASGGISLSGIVTPFTLALLAAPVIHKYAAPDVQFWGFALFLATANSITALPILGKMMMDMRISRTRLAAITIAAGASDDAIGWIALAVVTAIIRSNFNIIDLLVTLASTAGFLFVMCKLIRPRLAKWLQSHLDEHDGKMSQQVFGYLLVFVLICGIITHVIGIFALFGAFLAGAILFDVRGLREELEQKMKGIVDTVFLPVFFTYTGLHTNIQGFGWHLWGVFGLILAVAIGGKLGGCAVAARLSGIQWRPALCIGTMMNCRALMELIAINVGAALGVVTPEAYSMLVLMALFTTIMTTPVLAFLAPGTELHEGMVASGFAWRSRSQSTKVELQPSSV